MTDAAHGGRFHDRLGGDEVPLLSPREKLLVGRWQLQPAAGDRLILNSESVAFGDFVVPDLAAKWQLLVAGKPLADGLALRNHVPGPVDSDCVRAIGYYLGQQMAKGAGWGDWKTVVPLVPDMQELVNISPLDEKISQCIGHIAAVCHKPSAYLKVEIEHTPVAKARRLPVRAATYLGSHTEDWERPLIRSVQPKRVLSEIREDEWDIYENRVTARLIDHLSRYLTDRIESVRKAIWTFKNYTSAISGTHHRGRRIAALWGESFNSEDGRRIAQKTLTALENLRYHVLGLKNTKLYQSVPPRTYVATTLRSTNIFINHQHYRRVAELWRDLAAAEHAQEKTAREAFDDSQALCQAFDRFAFLLVIRAIEQLGYHPDGLDISKQVRPGETWRLTGESGGACTWQEDGTVRLEVSGQMLKMVALPMEFSRSANDEQAVTVLEQIKGACTDGGAIAVLYLSTPDSSDAGGEKPADAWDSVSAPVVSTFHAVGNDPRVMLPLGVGLLPVSPWDICSVERVARCLRWYLDSQKYAGLTRSISIQSTAQAAARNIVRLPWVDTSPDGTSLTIKRPVQPHEWDSFGLGQLEKNYRRKLEEAEERHELLSRELRLAVRRGATGTLNQQKRAANEQVTKAKEELEALQALLGELEKMRSRLGQLLVCPTCKTVVNPVQDFVPRENDCFQCVCPSCGTCWGMRMCSQKHKYAVVIPGGAVATNDRSPGWIDRLFGSDLLAVPAEFQNGNWSFVCPECAAIN